MKPFLLVLLTLIVTIQCQDYMVMSGGFIMSIVENNSTIHPASVIGYDPVSDTYLDLYNGGLLSVSERFYTRLEGTPFGVYGFTNEEYIWNGSNFEYSGGGLYGYNGTSNLYFGLNNGVSGSVRAISYFENSLVIAGSFKKVESISLQNYLEGKEDVEVRNIVFMDPVTKIYTELADPEGLLDNIQCEEIAAVASSGDMLFLYCASKASYYTDEYTIYTWDPINYTKFLYSATNLTINLYVDAQGDLFSLVDSLAHSQLAFFNASNGFEVSFIEYFVGNDSSCEEPEYAFTIPWNGGILIGMSYCADNFTFYWIDPSTGNVQENIIPALQYEKEDYVVIERVALNGAGNDIWVSLYDNRIYYFSSSQNEWTRVSMLPLTSFSILSMAWDQVNNWLMLDVNDFATKPTTSKWIKISANTFPPTGFQTLSNPAIATSAVISQSTVIQNPDGSYDIVVMGDFNYGGGSGAVSSLATFSNGSWQNYTIPGVTNTTGVSDIFAYGTVMFYSYPNYGVSLHKVLPIGAYDTLGSFQFSYIPDAKQSYGITAMYANDNFVVFGGWFEVLLPDGNLYNGVVVYDIQQQDWFGLPGIPDNINNDYLALSINTVDGVQYLAFGGYFTFTIGNTTYKGLGVFNLDERTWGPVSFNLTSATTLNGVLFNSTGVIYTGGSNGINGTYYTCSQFNYNNIQGAPIGNLTGQSAEDIVLYTDSNYNSYIYAAGQYNSRTKGTAGLIYSPLGGLSTQSQWSVAGQNLLFDYYYEGFGAFWTMLTYQNGGKGLNGVNN